MLHYVALCEKACDASDLISTRANQPSLAGLAEELRRLWFGLLPGFHRFLLDQGQVVLTLCVGEQIGMLRMQQFHADEIVLSSFDSQVVEFTWLVKALARCCRRGTTLSATGVPQDRAGDLRSALYQHGFAVLRPLEGNLLAHTPCLINADFDPAWQLKNNRPALLAERTPGRCTVIGAGLAGASVAYAMARRGWTVTVLDRAAGPAAGASGLPVGLVVPHVSSDDCALSRMSRAGVRLMLQQAEALLTMGQDWGPSGVLERQVGGTPQLPKDWPAAGLEWAVQKHTSDSDTFSANGIWHHRGAWIKPASLVKAWLEQPGISFRGSAEVANLRRESNSWQLLDDAGYILGTADCVIFANAENAFQLLHKLKHSDLLLPGLDIHLPKTKGMLGMLNWNWHQDTEPDHFPAFPVNGSGSVVPHIPLDGSQAWFMGSTYQPSDQPERCDSANQSINFEHLERLLPELAQHLAPAFASDKLKSWKASRCVTQDRLPAVGPLTNEPQASLWLCAGLGSRGLSFSVLCAELLAARISAEPWPIEAKLARMLEALRA
jgi:tRNA 5-methylaminomethyl-2-thiouridine biosynthesis bifunctional protein